MIAKTTTGPVRGTAAAHGAVFKGIPYAAPPVGDRRYRPPAPHPAWTGPYDATAYGPAAPQPHDLLLERMFGLAAFPTSEDNCLNLNIWTPAVDDARRPVMVWIHGGAFLTGSGRDPVFDGARLAARRDVVVVTINYRLGALGFLHLADVLGEEYAGSGNLGLLDQVAALTWVRDNIGAFGGDPGNVTVFGQSAGATSIAALMTLPAAEGLFHKAIVQSGNGEFVLDGARATAVTHRVLGALGIDPADAATVLKVPVEDVVRAQDAVGAQMRAEGDGMGLPFMPVVDGSVLTRSPLDGIRAGDAAHIPLIVGCNLEESRLFRLLGEPPAPDEATLTAAFRAAYADPAAALAAYRAVEPDTGAAALAGALTGDRMFRGPSSALAHAQADHTPHVWSYLFTWRSTASDGRLGACHSLDLPFTFDNLHPGSTAQFTGPNPPQALADAIGAAWSRFARTGDPGSRWEPFDGDVRRTVILDGITAAAVTDPLAAIRDLELAGGKRAL